MVTVDLSAPPSPAAGLLEGLPRRLTVTLPELRWVARHVGNAPLPFDPVDARADRHSAAAAVLDELSDPVDSLTRRGLLTDRIAPGLAGAVGLLATPTLALDLDLTVPGCQLKAWHRGARGAVAMLATSDGIVFELGWCAWSAWPDEVTRAARLPEDAVIDVSDCPGHLEMSYALVDAACEMPPSQRASLLPVLIADTRGEVIDATGRTLPDAAAVRALTALATEGRGRLRGLLRRVGDDPGATGVVSWTLLADGWHAIRPRRHGDVPWVSIQSVTPDDLAHDLAAVLTEVAS